MEESRSGQFLPTPRLVSSSNLGLPAPAPNPAV